MTNTYPSIFNTVIGPVMRGPSSSHTAASVRIGQFGRNLLGKSIKRAIITFDPQGSLASNYRGQGSAMGLAAGFLGMEISDDRLVDAESICRKQDLELEYRLKALEVDHPSAYHIYLESFDGEKVRYLILSTGGGMIQLVELNGKVVDDDREYVSSLYPIQALASPVLPFSSIEEAELLLQRGATLAQCGLDYESALGGVRQKEIKKLAGKHLRVMLDAVATGMAGTSYTDRILQPQSHYIAEAEKKRCTY